MKKKFVALLLCAALLLPPALAQAAAGPWDPLISLSYIHDIFLPPMRQSIHGVRGTVSQKLAMPSLVTFTMMPGQRMALYSGQQFTLLTGAAELTAFRGEAVDATLGEVAGSGPVKRFSRYIVCENAAFSVAFSETSLVSVSGGTVSGGVLHFTDVDSRDWFFQDLMIACYRGLVNGVTLSTYEPHSTLTVAQCLKLCACMHQLWWDGTVTLENSPGEEWYRSYTEYALAQGILSSEYEDYNAVISRGDFIVLFYRALPEENYSPINAIPLGAIPDVAGQEPFAQEVYAMYRAGILTGYPASATHAAHAFDAASSITRAEVAAILNRMFDQTARQYFTYRHPMT